MSNSDSDFSPEGEWDDRGELAWNEFDWRQFLRRHDDEVQRFLKVYDGLKASPERMDEAACEMGWDREDWAPGDAAEADDAPEPETENDEGDDFEPYTIHRHPVFVVTRALYHDLHRSWEEWTQGAEAGAVSASDAWDYAKSLHGAQSDADLALQALDMGDFALTICHYKLALENVNRSLGILSRLPAGDSPDTGRFLARSRLHLFDIRELWLRVMRDCREEIQRRFDDRQ